jgi:hypothetical protein
MTTAMAIHEQLESKKAAERSEAQVTWNKLAQKVFNGGNRTDLSAKELDLLSAAAETLVIENYPDAFAAAVDALEAEARIVADREHRTSLKGKDADICNRKFRLAREFLAVIEEDIQFHQSLPAGRHGEIDPLHRVVLCNQFAGNVEERLIGLLRSSLDFAEPLRLAAFGK